MTGSSREGDERDVEMSRPWVGTNNGPPPVRATGQRYCGYCGTEVDGEGAPERFGELFCSQTHAEEFVKGVRAARVQSAAAPETVSTPHADQAAAEPPAGGAAKPWNLKMALKMAACCGAPLLALVLLAGGGGALLGAAGAALPLLLALACPLGMFFMMRGMMKGSQGNKPDGREGEK
ncbi:MAG: DUF2933 domain-containing protein [Candidatus Rokuibacteriota bacterium]